VDYIMGLVKKHLLGEIEFYRENGIRIRYAGDISGLPPDIAKEVLDAVEGTRDFPGMQVILAINYGGRDEIVRAVRKSFELQISGLPGHEDSRLETQGARKNAKLIISEALISANRDNPDVPDVDLIIRTGGESRTSNFLLWESAYSELYFSDKLWPDWTAADLEAAISDFKKRSRRFGAVP
jgi:undecaprenyl diphosphate synthase